MYKIDTVHLQAWSFEEFDEPLFHSSWPSVCLLTCKFKGKVPSARSQFVELSKEGHRGRFGLSMIFSFPTWNENTQAKRKKYASPPTFDISPSAFFPSSLPQYKTLQAPLLTSCSLEILYSQIRLNDAVLLQLVDPRNQLAANSKVCRWRSALAVLNFAI